MFLIVADANGPVEKFYLLRREFSLSTLHLEIGCRRAKSDVCAVGDKKQDLKQPTAQFAEVPNYTVFGDIPRSFTKNCRENNYLDFIRNIQRSQFPLQITKMMNNMQQRRMTFSLTALQVFLLLVIIVFLATLPTSDAKPERRIQ
ncbi:hypothetical protein NPIL_111701 [Nephila pilipes]|uniref:Uncharacterized protein n=1 Tax=Nephila pilipes TaxID=299642 RepID=A0A8X6UM58_NEPPI|nr:hypothetical protein NPIL_111701 [Nephila pilipes]